MRTSKTIDNNNNPVWNLKKQYNLSFEKKKIEDYRFFVQIFDRDMIGSDFIGEAEIPLKMILTKTNKLHSNLYDLVDKNGKKFKDAQIEVEFKFIVN